MQPELVIVARPRDVGSFFVRRALPQTARKMVGPFIFYDHLCRVDFQAGQGLDVRPHPHIGLATVTYLFEGAFLHRDRLGYVQPIEPGAVNWMIAGRGIAHSERTPPQLRQSGGPLHGIQCWVALPREHEEIEPSFAHHYMRNVIVEGKKTKEQVPVYSYELLVYRALVDGNAMPGSLPESFVTSDELTPAEHVAIQSAAQKWVDSSISKTVNVPTDIRFSDFEGVYMDAYRSKLKGCTTFRFNPEVFTGVLVKQEDLEATEYEFTLEDGSSVKLRGDEKVIYDGEEHTAANLYDALKEGYYGKL